MRIPGLTISSGRIQTTAGATQVPDVLRNGWGFMNDGTLALDTDTPAGNIWREGLRISPNGALYCTQTASASDVWLAGVRVSTQGALVCSEDAGTLYVAGLPMNSGGLAVTDATTVIPDPEWANVGALFHFEGSDGSTVFTDEKGHTFSASGSNAFISEDTSLFGNTSGSITGTGVVAAANHADMAVGGAYTLEWAMKLPSLPSATRGLIMMATSNGSIDDITVAAYISASNVFRIFDGNDGSTSYTFSDANWHQFAITRNSAGGTLLAFVDGVQVLSRTAGSRTQATGSVYMGRQIGLGGNAPASCYFDEVRYTRVRRYTGAYTPATSAFPNS